MVDASMDETFLRETFALALSARARGEQPFGAVLVEDGQIVHRAHDRCVEALDPTAHAERVAIREHCGRAGRLSLEGCTIYCNVEPCVMCAGAIKWAKISRVVFGASQPALQRLSGGRDKPSCASVVNTGRRVVEVVGPLLGDEALTVFAEIDFRTPLRERA